MYTESKLKYGKSYCEGCHKISKWKFFKPTELPFCYTCNIEWKLEESKLNQKEVKQIPIGPVIILCTICNLQPRRDKSKFCTDECAYKSTLRSNAKSIKNARAIKKASND
jgi:hypothetical protein